MKQNITLAVDKRLLKRIRAFAAERGTSVSGLFAEELKRIVESDKVRAEAYEKAKRRALADLRSPPFHLGGEGFWHGLILAATEGADPSELLSEDLNHGQIVESIKIVNAFVPPDRQF